MTNNLKEEIENMLQFSGSSLVYNYTARKRLAAKFLTLINQKEIEAKSEMYDEFIPKLNELNGMAETLTRLATRRGQQLDEELKSVNDRIKQLKEELKGGKD